MKRFHDPVPALAFIILLSASALGFEGDRPPVPFSGAWSYSGSGSRNGKSCSESLSVKESRDRKDGNTTRYADIQVEEMVNGVTHKKHKKHVLVKDVNAVLEKLITAAKKGLETGPGIGSQVPADKYPRAADHIRQR